MTRRALLSTAAIPPWAIRQAVPLDEFDFVTGRPFPMTNLMIGEPEKVDTAIRQAGLWSLITGQPVALTRTPHPGIAIRNYRDLAEGGQLWTTVWRDPWTTPLRKEPRP